MASLSGWLGHGQVQCHIALTFLDKYMLDFIWANGYLGMWVIGQVVFGQRTYLDKWVFQQIRG